jgi:site-specific DNA-methyltransferase (adenine-specific)
VIQVRNCHGYAIHPTQKPEGIIRPILSYSVPPGGTVVDCFAGSGTTLVVARELGMKAIGIEADEAACAGIVGRLSQSVLQLHHFARPA